MECLYQGVTVSDRRDRDYFIFRAAVERAQSEKITDPAIASIHRTMADKYDELVASAEQASHPKLAV